MYNNKKSMIKIFHRKIYVCEYYKSYSPENKIFEKTMTAQNNNDPKIS